MKPIIVMKPFISVAKADIPIGQVFKIQSLLLDSNEYLFLLLPRVVCNSSSALYPLYQ